MENAKARAKAFADGAGVKVGDVLAITETTTTDPVYFRSLGAADIASTPIEPGQSATTVSVTVRYAIDR